MAAAAAVPRIASRRSAEQGQGQGQGRGLAQMIKIWHFPAKKQKTLRGTSFRPLVLYVRGKQISLVRADEVAAGRDSEKVSSASKGSEGKEGRKRRDREIERDEMVWSGLAWLGWAPSRYARGR